MVSELGGGDRQLAQIMHSRLVTFGVSPGMSKNTSQFNQTSWVGFKFKPFREIAQLCLDREFELFLAQ